MAPANIAWCVAHGLHVVSGTTGFEPDPTWAEQRDVGVFIAANFAIGAVLMSASPRRRSGTCRTSRSSSSTTRTSRTRPRERRWRPRAGWRRPGIAGAAPPDATAERVAGARGADVEGIRVHSVRLPGLVAHQEVILGGLGQTLTIRHDSISHWTSFMPGVLMAVKAVRSRPGLTVGLDALLEDGNG